MDNQHEVNELEPEPEEQEVQWDKAPEIEKWNQQFADSLCLSASDQSDEDNYGEEDEHFAVEDDDDCNDEEDIDFAAVRGSGYV